MLDRVSLQLKSFCLFFSSVEPRLDGEEYYEFVDEFMAAVKLRWPRALSKLISRNKYISLSSVILKK